MSKFSDIKIGDKAQIKHIITLNDINKFVELTGDDNRLHVDEKFASRTQFKKTVVHGMLGASFISTIIGTKLPGDGALWFSQTLDFLLPVRIGDKLTVIAEVMKKNDKENVIELKTEIFNQNKQIVTKGNAKVKVVEPEDELEKKSDIKFVKQKVALVIGATGGIGRKVCIRLAMDGFNVIIHYNRNQVQAEELQSEIEKLGKRAIIVRADILNYEDIEEMITKCIRAFGRIDVLINSAASVIPAIKFQDLVWDDFSKQLELNIKSTFDIMKKIVPYMTENGYGKIINIGSLSVDKPNSEWSPYITAKSALIGLTKSLAFELGPKGIRINIVSPSLLDTELTADIPEKVKILTAAQTPLRRLALADDVACAISFLASVNSDFITGANIHINGGQIML
jgi:3-oxoacyl-[acyl-carrier protein] reductase